MTRGGLKWTFYDEDIIPAWVAEMDFGLAPAVERALHDAVDDALTGYPYPDAESAVAEAATNLWLERFHWDVDPSWVFPAPDVIEGIRRAIIHLTRAESPVVIHSPVYFPFYSMVERAGRELIEVRSSRDEDGRYTLNLHGIDRALEEGADSVVLCNPWNPTGRVFSEDELGELIELAGRHDSRIIADEVHSLISYGERKHTPVATLEPDRVVTVTSASKSWNLPGLKCAQVVLTSGRDRATWEDYFTLDKVGVGTFGLLANEAAYTSGIEWFEEVLGRLSQNRDLLTRLLAEHLPDVGYYPPEATYLAWLDMTAYGLDDPGRFIRDKARVALTRGRPFGTGADQFVRLNFATDSELISEMVERIRSALADR